MPHTITIKDQAEPTARRSRAKKKDDMDQRVSWLEDQFDTFAGLLPRMTAVETAVKQHGDSTTAMQKDMVRLEFEVKGIREQAKAHNTASIGALTEMKNSFEAANQSTQKLITTTAEEAQREISLISSTLLLDDEPNAPYKVKRALMWVLDNHANHKDSMGWVRKTVIGIVITALAAALYGGIVASINAKHIQEMQQSRPVGIITP